MSIVQLKDMVVNLKTAKRDKITMLDCNNVSLENVATPANATDAAIRKNVDDAIVTANNYTDAEIAKIVPDTFKHYTFSYADTGFKILYTIPTVRTDIKVYFCYDCDAWQFFMYHEGADAAPFQMWFSHIITDNIGLSQPIAVQRDMRPDGSFSVKNNRAYLTPYLGATSTNNDASYSYARLPSKGVAMVKGAIDLGGYVETDSSPSTFIHVGASSRGKGLVSPYDRAGGIEITVKTRQTSMPHP